MKKNNPIYNNIKKNKILRNKLNQKNRKMSTLKTTKSWKKLKNISSVQFSHSVVSNCLWPHESQHSRPPCPSSAPRVHPNSCIELVMPSSHLILWRPLLLLPPIPPSIRVFSNESTLRMRWPKYWSFSFSIIPSKEILGLRPSIPK